MPDYKTHITWSTVAGIGLGCVAKQFYGVSITQAVFGGVLCSLGGVLPDIDSNTSRAYQRCITTISGTCVLLLASRLRDFSLEPEGVVTTCAAVYFFIIYVIGGFVKKITIHRGMCHSIPFAVISGELIFILTSGSTELRLFKAFAIFLGTMIHLLLDEFNSFTVGSSSRRQNEDVYYDVTDPYNPKGKVNSRNKTSSYRKKKLPLVRIKNSFGTAFKLIDYKHMGTTIIFYIVAAFLGHCAMGVQSFLEKIGDNQSTIQGMTAIEHVKRVYPQEYELSVVRWIAENNLVLTPGNPDNEKWHELKSLLAIGSGAINTKEIDSAEKKSSLFNSQNKTTENESSQETKEVVSLLDVINWNSLNQGKTN